MRNEICTLIGMTSNGREVKAIEKEIYCTRKSTVRTEYYSAYSAGLKPKFVIEMDPMDWEMLADELKGPEEPSMVRYNSKDYNILRTYQVDESTMELTVG